MAATATKATLLNPLITGPLLILLTRAPDSIRNPVLQYLGQYVSSLTIERVVSALKWLSILGVARWASRFFSELAQNNFRLKSEAHRYDWPNEIALITGGTGGFGSLMAKSLAANGIKVICVDIRDGLPKDMEDNPKIHYYKCDITDPSAINGMAQKVKTEHGDPSILINNAGVQYEHTVLSIPAEKLKSIFDVNIISQYYLIQAFLPAMCEKKKGHIVSIASMASFVTQAGLVPYCNTKAAVLSLHEGLMQEVRVLYKAPEVKFTVVHPTFAATPMTQPFREQLKAAGAHVIEPTDVSEAVVKQILSGRGKQIVLAAGMGWVSTLRGWPQWFQQGLMHLTDGSMKKQFEMTEKGAR